MEAAVAAHPSGNSQPWENHLSLNGEINELNGVCSIAMINYQRVYTYNVCIMISSANYGAPLFWALTSYVKLA